MGLNTMIKGFVQQKLTWVENSVNHWILAKDRGAGHYLDFYFAVILNWTYFRFRSVWEIIRRFLLQ